MNTMLIVMILVHRSWTPIHAIEYPTETACQAAAVTKTDTRWTSINMAVCVPKLKLN